MTVYKFEFIHVCSYLKKYDNKDFKKIRNRQFVNTRISFLFEPKIQQKVINQKTIYYN